MKRRTLCTAACSLAMPQLARAQSARQRRIGTLSLSRGDTEAARIGTRMLADSMRRLGWEEGSWVSERRHAAGDLNRLDAMALELVRSNVEVILAALSPAVGAAQRATRTIPIVMIGATFPVESGFVQALARPGGNITGTAVQVTELYAKSFQIMRELSPGRSRVAVLGHSIVPQRRQLWEHVREEVKQAAKAMGLSVEFFDIGSDGELDGVLERIAASRADLMSVGQTGVFDVRARDIAEFAIRHKILATGSYTLFATFGGAMYYGSNLHDIIERSAGFVDRILRGAKPSALPVELPTRFDLILNRKTLQALGIVPPPRVLLRATEMIE